MSQRPLNAGDVSEIRGGGLVVYWCPVCKVGTGDRSWHSLRDGGLFPQNDTEHDCVRVDVAALLGALTDLVDDYELTDSYPTSDGHPLYAARELLTGSPLGEEPTRDR